MRKFAFLAALVAATPAIAASPSFHAELVSPRDGLVVTRGAAWTCTDGGACVTTSSASRPLVQCQLLAKETGTLASFAVDGRAVDAETLAKCNAKAR